MFSVPFEVQDCLWFSKLINFLFNGLARFKSQTSLKLTIGSCLACVHRDMDARGKFGEHERSVKADLRWLTTVFSGERVPCFNLAKNAKRGFLLDCLSL